ncbi:hypothetical protein [Haloechinothrix halophila]|uniref:hypothetical protein n=1 Tax=Haloechinothrix halophila TaxID=1069073 RepID=UPI000684198E|nr:hypothetical protein [Haloechinothrix halophila]
MDSARPLHEVFDALSRGALDDPVAALRDAGHDLPVDLLGDALAHYAGTADIAVAEHLAPFVMAHEAGEDADLAEALSLLASAPSGDIDELDAVAAEPGETLGIAFGAGSDDLDFGSGAADVGEVAGDAAGLAGPEGAAPLPEPDVEAQGDELPELFGTGSANLDDGEEPGAGAADETGFTGD